VDSENNKARSLLRMLRPNQWSKNVVVGAAFFFALWDRSRPEPLTLADGIVVLPAILIFCLVSSGIYIVNDIRDRESDRLHPLKKLRPIAAGLVSLPVARSCAVLLLVVGGAAACALSANYARVIGMYVAIQLAYSFWLKRVALVDIFVIAVGFVLRAIAGAVAFDNVTISAWLLLCTFLLALFLGLCKRRHEKLLVEDAENHRPSLENYNRLLLDQLIAISSAATIVVYSIYTLWPETVAKFGTKALGFTIPFVAFGVFRYLDLVYRKQQGGRPEQILLSDIPLLATLALYGLTIVAIFSL
jgi:4-hydroxybenzoate polyprenyltransferase